MRAHLGWWGALAAGLTAQTALFPLLFADAWRPDVTRALVLWVALTGLPRGGVVLAFAAGLFLDAASGCSLGFGVILRLGIYALGRPFRGVFFDDQPLLLPPFAVLAVAVEAALVGALSHVAFLTPLSSAAVFAVAWRQALVDILWVPLVFVGLELVTGRRRLPEVAP